MSNSSVIDQISRIHFTVKGIKWHPLFLAKLTGFIYRKKDAEAKKAFLMPLKKWCQIVGNCTNPVSEYQ